MKNKYVSFRITPRHRLQTLSFLFMVVTLTCILSAILALWRTACDPTLYETDPYRLCTLYASKTHTLSALWICLCEAVGGGLLLDYARKCDRPLLD